MDTDRTPTHNNPQNSVNHTLGRVELHHLRQRQNSSRELKFTTLNQTAPSDPAFDERQLYALRQKFHSLFPHGWDFILKETPESDWENH